jgi:two-component sensor histidine kinase
MTMTPDGQAVLNAFAEPILVVRTDGTVTHANKAARALLGEVTGATLPELSTDGADRLRTYLRQCSGSRDATIGKLVLRERSGSEHAFRCHGSLQSPRTDGAPATLLLRLTGEPEERFSALTQQVNDLNAEVRRRRRIQMMLKEALRERDLLLRELNHRVKNNLQMLLSMLSSARSGARHAETRAILERACSRVAAIGAAQNVFYRAGVGSIAAADFLDEVCRTVMRTLGEHELVLDIAPAELSSDLAAPVALMLNELITNAVKHGFADGRTGRIEVTLRAEGREFEVTVADDGMGFEPGEIRPGASGLGLVRGLAEKLGGRLELSSASGARCIVRFFDQMDTRAEGSS